MKLKKKIFKSFGKLFVVFAIVTAILVNVLTLIYINVYGRLDLFESIDSFNEKILNLTVEDVEELGLVGLIQNLAIKDLVEVVIIDNDDNSIYNQTEISFINEEILQSLNEYNWFNSFYIEDTYYHYYEVENTFGLFEGRIFLICKGLQTDDMLTWINTVFTIFLTSILILALFISNKFAKKISRPLEMIISTLPLITTENLVLFEENTGIQEINQLASAINSTTKRIVEESNEYQKYTNNLSHDLRTPLMKIKGYAEGLQYDIVDKNEATDIIIQQTDKVKIVIEALLELARKNNNKHIFEKADIKKEIETIVETYKGVLAIENKKINVHIDKNILVYINLELFERTINNLISNAMRYAKENIDIRVSVQGDNCVIFLKDDGEGIADIENSWNRFQKGDHGQFGLGLNIALEAVKTMSGDISAENDDGAVFKITLPLAKRK